MTIELVRNLVYKEDIEKLCETYTSTSEDHLKEYIKKYFIEEGPCKGGTAFFEMYMRTLQSLFDAVPSKSGSVVQLLKDCERSRYARKGTFDLTNLIRVHIEHPMWETLSLYLSATGFLCVEFTYKSNGNLCGYWYLDEDSDLESTLPSGASLCFHSLKGNPRYQRYNYNKKEMSQMKQEREYLMKLGF